MPWFQEAQAPGTSSWGATPEEVSRPLPGDNLVPKPAFNATRESHTDTGRTWTSFTIPR